MLLIEGAGTATFSFPAPCPSWAADGHRYEFGPSSVSPEGMLVAATKHPDGALEVRASDAGGDVCFRAALPPLPSGLLVTLTWRAGAVTLFVNGTRAGATCLAPAA